MSEVLVDSSVWIGFFRDQELPSSMELDALLEQKRVVICNLIKAEILPFLPSRKLYDEVSEYFSALAQAEEYGQLWNDIIQNQYKIIRNGLNGVGIPDMMICCLAMHHNLPLFTADRHFKLLAAHLPLRLFEPGE